MMLGSQCSPCCGRCPCDSTQPVEENKKVIGVSGILLGGRRIRNWFDVPFSEQPDPVTTSCDQDFLTYGEYDKQQITSGLANAVACTFDGFAVASGDVVCFYSSPDDTKPSAAVVGPVIVNNLQFKNSITSDGTVASENLLGGYTMHWAQLGFFSAAQKMTVCVHDGSTPSATIVFLPAANPLP